MNLQILISSCPRFRYSEQQCFSCPSWWRWNCWRHRRLKGQLVPSSHWPAGGVLLKLWERKWKHLLSDKYRFQLLALFPETFIIKTLIEFNQIKQFHGWNFHISRCYEGAFYYKFEYIWSQKRMEDISDMELDYCSLATNVTQMLENFKTKQATNIVVVIATVWYCVITRG